MNVQSIGSIFKGLCQTGAWGCFDEFNRIPIEVLSVVSTQVASILNSLREKRQEFDFMGEIIKLIPTVGMFITMNPGYAGRTELPENLKISFRSCAMVVPDMDLICENMLMSEGFLQAFRLSRKFTTLYRLSSELLSKQKHYDWGLRATKAVLRVAGTLKRAEPTVDEDRILMRALRDFNIPKLVDEDKPIFLELVNDLFPGLGNTERKVDNKLVEAIQYVANKHGLQTDDTFILKCVELAELCSIRHSLFIIGPAGCGKSQLWRVLVDALRHLGQKTIYEVINPKAVKNDELYGWLSKTDWHDGILSTIMRNMSRNRAPYTEEIKNKWLILDGDIDPDWIESLNSVMDDNKLLTLVSNERIPLTPSMRLIFEISNLDNATPATVSRAGIIYINAKDVGYKPFLDSWIEQRNDEKEKSSLLALFNKYLTSEYMHEMMSHFHRIIPLSEINMVKTMCYLLEGLLSYIDAAKKQSTSSTTSTTSSSSAPLSSTTTAASTSATASSASAADSGASTDNSNKDTNDTDDKSDGINTEKEIFEANFVFACIWAFGGATFADKSADHRKEFSEWWKRVFTTIKFPKDGTVFDYFPDVRTGKMIAWQDIVPAFDAPDDAYLVTKVFVPTVDTCRFNYLLNLLIPRQRPTMLVGGAGTGKTSIINQYLKSVSEQYAYCSINLNYYSDARSLQRIMESVIDKRTGKIFGPSGTKKLIYFIDDLNMPYVDQYGTQSPSCLIRQHMDYGCWYDTIKLERKEIQDVQYISCMNPTSGSFTIDSRLQGQFATFSCLLPSKQILTDIYKSIIDHHYTSVLGTAFNSTGSIYDIQQKLIRATIELHDSICIKFIPSTKKFHYQFNLRDLSAVFQGLCMIHSDMNVTPKLLVNLWTHECKRVFSDRLVSPQDETILDSLITNKTKQYFKEYAKPETNNNNNNNNSNNDSNNNNNNDDLLLFTNFHAGNKYMPADKMETIKLELEKRLYEYNQNNPVMNLELFSIAIEHVCRIVRIINNPRGNALLVGVGGSGKQSLAKLSSFICDYEISQISVTQGYTTIELKGELQQLYYKTGLKNRATTFILTDTQIVDDKWLIYINDLLSSGYIPDLFNNEDKDNIVAQLRNEAKNEKIVDTKEAIFEYFINKVRTNLHVILCFSPVGEKFRIRCRKFPALINCTHIDWFHPWPRDALISVASRFLSDINFVANSSNSDNNNSNNSNNNNNDNNDNNNNNNNNDNNNNNNNSSGMDNDALRLQIAQHMATVHLSVNDISQQYQQCERRYNYTTPKSFLELINFYKSLYKKKGHDLLLQMKRLEKGIATLQSTQKHVAILKEDLTKTLVIVGEKAAAATELIGKMGVERKKVEEQQELAAIEAQKAKAVSDIANQIAEECRRDLEHALPLLEKAKDAVNCLNKNSLGVLRSFANPPDNVLFVTEALLIMKKIPGKRDWAAAKKMMKDIGKFLEELKTYDSTSIDEDVLIKLKPILEQKFFNEEDMKAYSEAAANLCNWIVNSVQYNGVYKNVAPKVAAQKKAEEEFEVAQSKLKVVQDKVAAMEAKLKTVTDALKQATDEKNAVEIEAANCQKRLELAKRLVDGLADENTRWGKSILQFQQRQRTMVGDTLLAASFVSYIGAFNQKYRSLLWKDIWLQDLMERKIPLTDNVDPLMVLASDSDFAKWKNEGLAADRVSLENASIITQCSRWPLLIDPQLQAMKWIRNHEKNLCVIQLSQKRWLSKLIHCVSNGISCLIENVGEELDASLDPILSRAVIQRGHEKFVRIGNEEITYDDNFKLYIQTKLFNPHYGPEISAQCTIINFIVTEEGLEDQLLALVVNKEKPELEEKRTNLVRAINDYMVSLTDLENELLERLSNAPADILSDVALIEGLEKTKHAAMEIEQKVELAKKQEISINLARNEFRMVAAEGSWLYFLLIQLCIIDHMYQYSLDAFIGFFSKAMVKAKKSDSMKERVNNLRECIRLVIFQWVNRGLFEKHKLIFSTQLCFKLMSKNSLKSTYDIQHYDYLIRGSKKFGIEKPAILDWVPVHVWCSLQKLIELPGFERFVSDMIASPNRFKEWYNKSRPEIAPLPLDWRKLDETSPFMKLLIVRAMRVDRMSSAMTYFVSDQLTNGHQYTECDAGKSFLDILYYSLEDASPIHPIFFILSAGADPIHQVEIIAKRMNIYEHKFHRVALGQGQDVIAMDRLATGHKQGHWVVLENIHLMPRWTIELEKKLDEFIAEGSHPDFRIFLSAEPSKDIPIGLLERCIKLTNEPPQGLKQNVKRAFASFEKDEFEFKDPKVKSILFGLCHFHSILIERMKFGSKGWNRSYPFNTGDLMNSAAVLSNYMDSNNNDKIPWKDLRYIFGEILYGGHITDDWDRLICTTYLEYYMKDELLDETELYPFNENFLDEHFRSPPVLPYDQYFEYIDNEMKTENPVAFGLHPNAEIAVKTKQANELFTYIMDLQPRSTESTADTTNTPQNQVQMLLQQILTDKAKGIEGINFNLDDISNAIEERGPFQNVFLQECDRMNQLCFEIRRSLKELDLGISGELQMSEKMETLFQALYFGRIPDKWTKLSYPSQRPLAGWIDNLIARAAQLQSWVEDPSNIPMVVNISHLFNPQSFLTAILQKTAQKQKLELDKLVISTEVTRKSIEQVDSRSRDGAYIYGLYLEGARWNWNNGVLEECLPKEMSCLLPVIACRAILAEKLEKNGVYRCPVYKTQQRGPTYVFSAMLRTKLPAAKWVLAGVAMMMEVDE